MHAKQGMELESTNTMNGNVRERNERQKKMALVFDHCLPAWAKDNVNADQFMLRPNLVRLTPCAVDIRAISRIGSESAFVGKHNTKWSCTVSSGVNQVTSPLRSRKKWVATEAPSHTR
jgi:hypothetical protein